MIFEDYHEMWVREEDGGLLAGAYYDPEVRERRAITVGARTDAAELPENLGHHGRRLAEEFAATVPAFGGLRVKEMRSGLPAYTSDGRNLLGPVDGVDGFYVAGGDNEAGITHAPGLGKLLAEEIVEGRALRDITALRPERFAAAPAGAGAATRG
jgi:glycine/D-amino acid oxidase-like deaminating enzyme